MKNPTTFTNGDYFVKLGAKTKKRTAQYLNGNFYIGTRRFDKDELIVLERIEQKK